MKASDRNFYNEIYTAHPGKWTSVDRDYLAFKIVSGMFSDPPGRVMDFGCGNGHTLAFFRSQWPNAHYTGVDISDVAIDLAIKRVPGAEFYRVIPTGLWDAITIMGVAEHFEAPAKGLANIANSLKPTGFIYLEVPNCLAYSPDKTEGFRKTHEGSDQAEWHWTRESWKQSIQDAGLVIVRGYMGAAPEWEFIWLLGRRKP